MMRKTLTFQLVVATMLATMLSVQASPSPSLSIRSPMSELEEVYPRVFDDESSVNLMWERFTGPSETEDQLEKRDASDMVKRAKTCNFDVSILFLPFTLFPLLSYFGA